MHVGNVSRTYPEGERSEGEKLDGETVDGET